jgi:hypothetical protein
LDWIAFWLMVPEQFVHAVYICDWFMGFSSKRQVFPLNKWSFNFIKNYFLFLPLMTNDFASS